MITGVVAQEVIFNSCENNLFPELCGMVCHDILNCCDCGGCNCACSGCFSCNACEYCLNEED